jgi:hypothetical protein
MVFFLHKNKFFSLRLEEGVVGLPMFFPMAESCCGFIIDRWGRWVVGQTNVWNDASSPRHHHSLTKMLVWTEYSNDEIGSAGGDGWRGVTEM